MPGEYLHLDRSDVNVTVYWGRISLVDILETITSRLRDSDLKSAKASVIDLSHASWTDSPPSTMREEMDRLRPAFAPPRMPTVLIAPGEFFYGFGCMYALVQIIYGAAKVSVARSWTEAAATLGIDLSEAEAWARGRAAPSSP